MQHFFVTSDQINEKEIIITGRDVNHIKNVLRMKIGEELEINDGVNGKYIGKINTMNTDNVMVEIITKTTSDTELDINIHLFQGLPKGDKMEFIVEKSVELGVNTIIPVEMKRSIVKLDEKKKQKKVDKWNSCALAAAKQSARGIVPQVSMPLSYSQALKKADELDYVLVPYELAKGMDETKEVIGKINKGNSIGVFIGPEGGFDENEIKEALAIGAMPISLGSRILRTETAGICTLSILMYHIETM